MTVKVLGALRAIERRTASVQCFDDWEELFLARAVEWTPSCYWNETIGVAGTFFNTHRNGKPVFWIAFAGTPISFRQRFIVEVNPPQSGVDRRFQGVFAEDEKGRRFVLHRGALHPARLRIRPEDFFKHATIALHDVQFSDGSDARCAMVAPLDYGPDNCVESLAQFVRDCSNARDRLVAGNDDSGTEKHVFESEEGSPELRGNFSIPSRGESSGKRRHGDVWDLLKSELEALKLRPANARLGRYGPDMYTRSGRPLALFEIKVIGDSGSLQQALGQLLIYEVFLGGNRLKVVVLPKEPRADIQRVLRRYNVRWLTYDDPDKPKFDRQRLRKLFVR